MSNVRPTITVTLPYDHTIVLNEYITGSEWEEIVGIYRRGKEENKDAAATGIEADKHLYALLNVSVDGDATDPYYAVRELPKIAYDKAIEAIAEATDGKKKLVNSLSPSQPTEPSKTNL